LRSFSRVLLLLLVLGLGHHMEARAAACEEPSTRTEVGLVVADAMEGFRNLDALRFELARNKVFTLLTCLDETLLPRDAARVHAMMAVDAFLRKDEAASIESFRAALAADRSYDLPPGMVPEGHLLKKRLEEARARASAPPRPLPSLGPHVIWVDGAESRVAPSDRPTLLQRVQETGKPLATVYLATGAPLPAWLPPAAPVPQARTRTPRPRTREPRPWGLVGAAGLSALATGASYVLAMQAHDAFQDPSTGYTALPDLQTRANVFSWAWIGGGALTVGLTTWTVVEW
jgi:hypothetical protein